MNRLIGIGLTLGVALGALGFATDAVAQAADAKRTLKVQKLFYKEPGLIEVEPRAMRKTLMLTGSVPDEAAQAKANELAKKIRGITDIRDRLRIVPPDVAAATDEEITAKLDEMSAEDEDLEKALAKKKLVFSVTDANVVISGKLSDWSVAASLISSVRNVRGIQTIDFDKLKY